MKKSRNDGFLRAAALALTVALAAIPVSAEAAYGAAGAAATASSWTVEQMLGYALEDEYLARAEYVLVMGKFGVGRPFSNIKQAEDRHVGWLEEVYAARNLSVPADAAASRAPSPSTLLEAYKTGEKAEIDNIAMYAAFLRSPLLDKSENPDVKAVFERLLAASENHLRSFRGQLARY